MLALTAKHKPASFSAVPFFIRLSISFACSIASSFSSKKMFRSFDSGVAIFFENARTLSRAVSLPSLICFIFVFSVIFLIPEHLD